ncbi:MAG: NAD-dependent DNA ligase LigA [Candidatus Nomurabacteria bacterium]|jgi:DNA ligase (NAD+)|nr:NAD-dependent DNA ligase LigA [Candidatus Nomurabacteria bacterium]
MRKNNIPQEVAERYEKLKELIKKYRYDYNVLNVDDMPEAAADDLKHELADIEQKYPSLVAVDSPTQTVAGEVNKLFAKVEHKVPMISLKDVFDFQELSDWAERARKLLGVPKLKFFGDIKMDGVACALIYRDGKLVQGITRGNALVGEDITQNVMQIGNIPHEIRKSKKFAFASKGRVEIRGEVVMLKTDFVKINEAQMARGETQFANPRNLVAGTLHMLDAKIVGQRPMRFFGYDLICGEVENLTFDAIYDIIEGCGVETSGQRFVCDNIKGVWGAIERLDKRRGNLAFNNDGVVVKVLQKRDYTKLGVVGKAPRGAAAYKYAAETATAVVRDIVMSLGRTGIATPVATFDTVRLSGTTVKHASRYNADEIERLDLRIGDTVVVYKAGEIIPKISQNLVELRPSDSLPFDYEKALKEQHPNIEFVRDGEAAWRAKNLDGRDFLIRALQYFVSRAGVDIIDLGKKTIVDLVDKKLVKDLADIYYLEVKDFLKLDGFALKSASQLFQSVEEKKVLAADRFLGAVGIPNIGQLSARELIRHFGSLEKIAEASEEELLAVDNVGKIMAEDVIGWFASEDNVKLLQKFWDAGVSLRYEKVGGVLDGQSFVITGSLAVMSRDDAARKITSLGGEFQTAITSATKFLVVGDDKPSSKRKKAEKLGVKIINEREFLEKIK